MHVIKIQDYIPLLKISLMIQFTYCIYRNSIPSGLKKGEKIHFYMYEQWKSQLARVSDTHEELRGR